MLTVEQDYFPYPRNLSDTLEAGLLSSPELPRGRPGEGVGSRPPNLGSFRYEPLIRLPIEFPGPLPTLWPGKNPSSRLIGLLGRVASHSSSGLSDPGPLRTSHGLFPVFPDPPRWSTRRLPPSFLGAALEMVWGSASPTRDPSTSSHQFDCLSISWPPSSPWGPGKPLIEKKMILPGQVACLNFQGLPGPNFAFSGVFRYYRIFPGWSCSAELSQCRPGEGVGSCPTTRDPSTIKLRIISSRLTSTTTGLPSHHYPPDFPNLFWGA